MTFDPLFDLYYFAFLVQWVDGVLLEIHGEVTSFFLKILDPMALITFYTDWIFSWLVFTLPRVIVEALTFLLLVSRFSCRFT